MKKVILVGLMAVLLAGCGVGQTPSFQTSSPIISASPAPAKTAMMSSPASAEPISTPQLTPYATEAVTPEPSQSPEPTFVIPTEPLGANGFPPVSGVSAGPALPIGSVGTSDGLSIYYTKQICIDGPSDYNIYKRNAKTGKTKLIRELHSCDIIQIFVDAEGTLYYCTESEDAMYSESKARLYRYSPKKDVLISDKVYHVERVQADKIIFSNWESNDTVLYQYNIKTRIISKLAVIPSGFTYLSISKQPYFLVIPDMESSEAKEKGLFPMNTIYTLDLTNGKYYEITQKFDTYSVTDDGTHVVAIRQEKTGSLIWVFDFSSQQIATLYTDIAFPVSSYMDEYSTYVSNDVFIILLDQFVDDGDKWDHYGTLYRYNLKSGLLLDQQKTDSVMDAMVYHGNWLVYTAKDTDMGGYDELGPQCITMYDGKTNRFRQILLDKTKFTDIDQAFFFEAVSNSIWMIRQSVVDMGTSYCWRKVQLN